MAVKKGDLVKFHYTGRLENGEVFDSSVSAKPMVCEIGHDRFVKGIEEGIIGMEKGQKKRIEISPQRGYGLSKKELIMKVDKRILEGGSVIKGQTIKVKNDKGNVYAAKVIKIEPEKVTLDLNHPLAGRILQFDVEVLDIR